MDPEAKPRWLSWLTGAAGVLLLALVLFAVERPHIRASRSAIDRTARDVPAQFQSRPIPDIPPGFFVERRRRMDQEALAYAQSVWSTTQKYWQEHPELTSPSPERRQCWPNAEQLRRFRTITSCTVTIANHSVSVQVTYTGGNSMLATAGK